MRTTLELDRKLLDEISSTTGEKSITKAVDRALRKYLRQERKERLLAALGTRELDLADWYEVRHQERT